jgi:hypothetical protein
MLAATFLQPFESNGQSQILKINAMNDFLSIVGVFGGLYFILKLFTDFLLRRKIIKSGHIEKAGILGPVKAEGEEVNKYPSLKWGLVFLMAGMGLVVMDSMRGSMSYYDYYRESVLPIGIELVAISSGFLIYFLIVALTNKKK